MRDRFERFVLLPFSMGCVSESSIAIGPQYTNRSKRANSTSPRIPEDEKEEEGEYEDDEESLSDENSKSPANILAAPKFQRLLKNFKNFSHFFVYKDEEAEEDDMGMEIGFPTDVKHVTHIGIDGSSTSILSKGWDNLKTSKSRGLPSVPLTPSELAMAAQADKLNLRGLI